jgi:predicted RNA binding protein YcfA (HicA-like mRNA interferase family)
LSKLPRLSGKEVIKTLSRIGFRVTRQKKHVVLRHDDGGESLFHSTPNWTEALCSQSSSKLA